MDLEQIITQLNTRLDLQLMPNGDCWQMYNQYSKDVIDEDTMRLIAQAINLNPELKHLSFHCCYIRDETLNILSQAIATNKNLEILDLSGNDLITDIGIGYLVSALKMNSTLELLDLKACSIDDEGVILLSDYLSTTTSLEDILLGSNIFSDEAVQEIAKALIINRSLKSIDLHSVDFSEEGGKYLANCLSDNKTLREIRFGDISYEGLKSFANTLNINSNLVQLSIADSYFTKESINEILTILNNTNLEILDLEYNEFVEVNFALLASGIINTNLCELHLSNSKLEDVDINALSCAFARMPNLTMLDISHNNISDAALEVLCKNLNSTQIQRLNISSNNNIKYESLSNLTEIIKDNTTLSHLHIGSVSLRPTTDLSSKILDMLRVNVFLIGFRMIIDEQQFKRNEEFDRICKQYLDRNIQIHAGIERIIGFVTSDDDNVQLDKLDLSSFKNMDLPTESIDQLTKKIVDYIIDAETINKVNVEKIKSLEYPVFRSIKEKINAKQAEMKEEITGSGKEVVPKAIQEEIKKRSAENEMQALKSKALKLDSQQEIAQLIIDAIESIEPHFFDAFDKDITASEKVMSFIKSEQILQHEQFKSAEILEALKIFDNIAGDDLDIQDHAQIIGYIKNLEGYQ